MLTDHRTAGAPYPPTNDGVGPAWRHVGRWMVSWHGLRAGPAPVACAHTPGDAGWVGGSR